MSDKSKPPKPPGAPPDGVDQGATDTGAHRIFRTPDGRTFLVPLGAPEDTAEEVTRPIPRKPASLLSWLTTAKNGSWPPGTVLLGALLGLASGSLGGRLSVSYSQDDPPGAAVCETCASAETVDQLVTEIAELNRTVVALRAELRAHKELDAHPGAIYRMKALELQMSEVNDTIDVLHPRR